MKANNRQPIGSIFTCRDCAHAALVQTASENPVLAQCRMRPTSQHPNSPYMVFVASSPACASFSLFRPRRKPALVDWRKAK